MEFINSLFYFILVVGVLVFIHEFGHFIAARMCGIHTDIFSFGMGPRLFGFNKKDGFKFGNIKDWEGNGLCDYRICLLPIGGYVKVSGMVDESIDTTFVNSEPKPHEFRSKNLAQKVFVLAAGVIMNVLVAIVIFGGIALFNGKILWKSTEIGYVDKNSIAGSIGLLSDDKIISINNKPITTWEEVLDGLTIDELGSIKKIRLIRNGETKELVADGKVLLKSMTGQKPLGLFPKNSFVIVKDVEKSKPAGKLGLTSGDTIVSVNNEKILAYSKLTTILSANKNKKVEIEWKRKNQLLKDSITPDSDGKLGFYPDVVYSGIKIKQSYTLIESIGVGIDESIKNSTLLLKSIAQIFKGNITVKESLGGPIMIAKSASMSAKMGIDSFLRFMALLSVTLAIFNILPFPALDGGHIVFALIETIIRREIPIKIKIYIQNTGMILLLVLMAYALYNDIMRLFK